MAKGKRKRLVFIDLARAYAIFLVLLYHLLITMNAFDSLGQKALYISQFTKTAAPLFMFMFGFMIEFVYVVKARNDGCGAVHRRILIRSFQCYVAFALTSCSAVIGGYFPMQGVVTSLVLLSDSRFGNILRTYSILLLITPLIISLRIRFGVKSILLLLVLLIIGYLLPENFQSFEFGLWNHPLNVILGIGVHRGGPSVFGAMSFYLAGMYIASSLTPSESGDIPRASKFYDRSVILLATCLVLGHALIAEELKTVRILFANGFYRAINAPAYYIIGIISSVFTILLFRLLFNFRKPPAVIKLVLPMGVSSLIAFTTGNIILNIFGGVFRSLNLYLAFPLFFMLVVFITIYIEKVPTYDFFNDLMNFRYKAALMRTPAAGWLNWGRTKST